MKTFVLVLLFVALVAAIPIGFQQASFNNTPGPEVPIWATYYCSLQNPGQVGSCNTGACGFQVGPNMGYGIAALNPTYYDGGSACQYQGSACGQCWAISGPSGSTTVIISDCCAGYPGDCSCLSCPGQDGCNWCGNDNLHFDLDLGSFETVCGQGGYEAGSCQLNNAYQTSC
eukprot:TRINITY_DN2402_c0_g1_i2.p1 TRINITY_DN2402_c0_g1~~TRINITY_DN2402_c0_g1_i2.p1  ORF type:complete len:172 (+),score=14.51 TRINITY_DN2402_c0_g1_i2:31-546(+)